MQGLVAPLHSDVLSVYTHNPTHTCKLPATKQQKGVAEGEAHYRSSFGSGWMKYWIASVHMLLSLKHTDCRTCTSADDEIKLLQGCCEQGSNDRTKISTNLCRLYHAQTLRQRQKRAFLFSSLLAYSPHPPDMLQVREKNVLSGSDFHSFSNLSTVMGRVTVSIQTQVFVLTALIIVIITKC